MGANIFSITLEHLKKNIPTGHIETSDDKVEILLGKYVNSPYLTLCRTGVPDIQDPTFIVFADILSLYMHATLVKHSSDECIYIMRSYEFNDGGAFIGSNALQSASRITSPLTDIKFLRVPLDYYQVIEEQEESLNGIRLGGYYRKSNSYYRTEATNNIIRMERLRNIIDHVIFIFFHKSRPFTHTKVYQVDYYRKVPSEFINNMLLKSKELCIQRRNFPRTLEVMLPSSSVEGWTLGVGFDVNRISVCIRHLDQTIIEHEIDYCTLFYIYETARLEAMIDPSNSQYYFYGKTCAIKCLSLLKSLVKEGLDPLGIQDLNPHYIDKETSKRYKDTLKFWRSV